MECSTHKVVIKPTCISLSTVASIFSLQAIMGCSNWGRVVTVVYPKVQKCSVAGVVNVLTHSLKLVN